MMLRIALIAAAASASSAAFVHPGVLVSSSQLDYMKEQIASGSGNVYDAFQKAKQSKYIYSTPQGPPANGIIDCGSYSKPDYGCSDEDSDATAAYLQALLFALTNSTQYATAAIGLVNHYGSSLKQYTNSNAPLQSAWGGSKWHRAAELLRYTPGSGWSDSDAKTFADTMYRVALPLQIDGSPSNGNWELSMIESMIGLAVWTENATLFDRAVTFWRQRVPAYFYISSDGKKPVPAPRGSPSWYGETVFNASVTGIAQETCRDLGHTSYGVAATMSIAETARIQGVDLFAEQSTRLAAALEFNANLLLKGVTPPSYLCGNGKVDLRYMPTFVVGYNALGRRSGLPLPHTAAFINASVLPLPDPVDAHMMVYETLTHGGSM